jgi:hypothetical protein
MPVISDLRPFETLLDTYDAAFLARDVEAFRKLHVGDGHVVFFDNHAGCDSDTYTEHEQKVAAFFQSGTVGRLHGKEFGCLRQGMERVSSLPNAIKLNHRLQSAPAIS